MDYLERAERIAKGFQEITNRNGESLTNKELTSFDAIAAYALMSIAESLKTIAAQRDS